jgi:hypothetical protein
MATVVTKWIGGGRGRDRGDHGESLYSNVLGSHVALSELEESPPRSREELAQLYADVVFARQDLTMRDLYDVWPRYEHDAYVGKYPESSAPVLMLNGTLDPQTPLEFAQAVAPHYVAPAQQLVVLPRAAHGTVDQSPTVKNGEACGKTLWLAFVGAPRSTLDTSCTERILPHDFQGGEALAGTLFGTASLWSRASARTSLSLEDELALRGEVMRARTSDWRLRCSESSRRLRKPAS